MPRFRLDQVRDSGDPSAVAALVEAVRSMGGGLDGLWLNAAFATIGPLEETTAGGFDRMMAVNVRGPMLQLAALSPLLNPGASIVVTSSSSTYEGAEQTSLYGATKGATIAMVRSWARQLAPRRIRVNSLVPGPIGTNFRRFLPEKLEGSLKPPLSVKCHFSGWARRTRLRRWLCFCSRKTLPMCPAASTPSTAE